MKLPPPNPVQSVWRVVARFETQGYRTYYTSSVRAVSRLEAMARVFDHLADLNRSVVEMRAEPAE